MHTSDSDSCCAQTCQQVSIKVDPSVGPHSTQLAQTDAQPRLGTVAVSTQTGDVCCTLFVVLNFFCNALQRKWCAVPSFKRCLLPLEYSGRFYFFACAPSCMKLEFSTINKFLLQQNCCVVLQCIFHCPEDTLQRPLSSAFSAVLQKPACCAVETRAHGLVTAVNEHYGILGITY